MTIGRYPLPGAQARTAAGTEDVGACLYQVSDYTLPDGLKINLLRCGDDMKLEARFHLCTPED